MKKLLLIAVFFSGMQATVFAQDRGFRKHSPRERAEMQTERMTANLSLSEAQKKSVLEINLKSAEKMASAGERSREAFKEAQKENEEQYKQVLTDEQFQKYETMKKERMEKMKDRRKGNNE